MEKKCFLLNYCISKFLDTEKELLSISDFRTAMLSLALAKHTKGSRPQLGEAYHIHINYPQELLFLLCMEDLDNEGSGGVLFQAFDFYARKTNNPTMPRYIVDEALQRYLSYSIYQKLTDNLGCYTLPLSEDEMRIIIICKKIGELGSYLNSLAFRILEVDEEEAKIREMFQNVQQLGQNATTLSLTLSERCKDENKKVETCHNLRELSSYMDFVMSIFPSSCDEKRKIGDISQKAFELAKEITSISFVEERALLEDICQKTQELGWDVVIQSLEFAEECDEKRWIDKAWEKLKKRQFFLQLFDISRKYEGAYPPSRLQEFFLSLQVFRDTLYREDTKIIVTPENAKAYYKEYLQRIDLYLH